MVEGLSTYADLRKLVLKKMPWSSKSKPELTKPECDLLQCEKVQNLCQNGGACVVTPDCTMKCRCPRGYSGFFCGVKVPDTVTTISLELTSGAERKGLLMDIIKHVASITTTKKAVQPTTTVEPTTKKAVQPTTTVEPPTTSTSVVHTTTVKSESPVASTEKPLTTAVPKLSKRSKAALKT